MFKILVKRIGTYLLYLCFSFGVGYLSTLGQTDYIEHVSLSVVPYLLTLMSIYAVISGQLITHLIVKFEKDDLKVVINAMERNIILEVLVLAFSFIFFASYSWLIDVMNCHECIIKFLPIFRNSLVCFDLLYFVYVVYDSIVGLYHLLKK